MVTAQTTELHAGQLGSKAEVEMQVQKLQDDKRTYFKNIRKTWMRTGLWVRSDTVVPKGAWRNEWGRLYWHAWTGTKKKETKILLHVKRNFKWNIQLLLSCKHLRRIIVFFRMKIYMYKKWLLRCQWICCQQFVAHGRFRLWFPR